MTDITYYVKDGRRYRPVSEQQTPWLALTHGSWLLTSMPGSQSLRPMPVPIDPDYARLLVAAKPMQDAMIKAMIKAGEAKPAQRMTTDKERAAWKAFSDVMGSDMPVCLQYGSAMEITDAGINALIEAARNTGGYNREQ